MLIVQVRVIENGRMGEEPGGQECRRTDFHVTKNSQAIFPLCRFMGVHQRLENMLTMGEIQNFADIKK